MERHPPVTVHTTNRVGSCVDEEFNNIASDIFVVASVVERRPSIIISSTGSGRKIFEKTSKNSLGDSLIAARK
jgi:hypothetical protein